MEYGLIGEHLGHSLSPELHRRLGGYDYALRELSPAELGPFLEARDFRGLNVTIPYKQAVIPFLDRLDPQAAAIGAVNTVVNRDGVLWGYNTDFGGLAALIRRAEVPVAGRTVLILGTGGTSRTALAVCRALGAAAVCRVSRTGREGALTYDEARGRFGTLPHPSAPLTLTPSPQGKGFGVLIINTTSVGMWPELEGCPLELGDFPGLTGVVDVVYNPLRTRLVLEARDRGLPALGGLFMLVKQAALACELFTGAPVAEEALEAAHCDLHRSRENLVLIGMPGAGKTTVGRLLAQKTGRVFVDIDEEIEARAGKPIAAIFAAAGEAGFRDLEAQVTRDLAARTGLVLATGGGTVLRAENLLRLRQTGRLYLLDRPLADLLPTPDRPLGDTPEKVARLYAARYELYRAAADEVLAVRGDAEEVAKRIRDPGL